MVAVSTSLVERAERIFSDLGYSVTADGTRLRAERKWRTVRVTPASEVRTPPTADGYHCVVAHAEEADDVRRRLATADADGEWAVLAVAEDGDYEVHHPSGSVPN